MRQREILRGPNMFDDIPPPMGPANKKKVLGVEEKMVARDRKDFETRKTNITWADQQGYGRILDTEVREARKIVVGLRARSSQESWAPKKEALDRLVADYEKFLAPYRSREVS